MKVKETLETKKVRLEEIAGRIKTDKHLKFANLVAQGYSGLFAHEQTHPGDQKFRSACASEMIKNNPVLMEYIVLAREIANEESSILILASALDKREKLWDIIDRCTKKGRGFLPRPAIAAIAELNQMDGDRAPVTQKIEQTSVNRNVDFEAVSPQEASSAYQDMMKGKSDES